MDYRVDMLIEGRHKSRQLRRWKIIAVIALIFMTGSILGHFIGDIRGSGSLHFEDYIARIHIEGEIKDNKFDLSKLIDIAENDRIKAVIVHVNSPGGAVVPSEALYDVLREIGDVKPIVSVLGSFAASGGYIIALSGDYIISRRNTLTGSIGVIFEWPNAEDLLDFAGIDINTVKTGRLKGEPNYHSRPDARALENLQGVVDDTQNWFRDLVGSRRSLSGDALARVSDGRVFTGHQALSAGLVDVIGGESAAVSWLRDNRDIGIDLEIIDTVILKDKEYSDIFDFITSKILSGFESWLDLDDIGGWGLRSQLKLD